MKEKFINYILFSDAYQGVPDLSDFKQEARDIAKGVLEDMKETTPNAGRGPQILSLLGQVQMLHDSPEWKDFVDRLSASMAACLPSSYNSPGRGKTYPMPTEVRTIYTKGLSQILTSKMKQEYIVLVQDMLPEEPSDKIMLFLSPFMRRFGHEILAYVFQCMKKAVAPNAVPMQKKVRNETEMKNFKEIVHYVGVSVVRRVLRMALPLQEKYTKWSNIIQVLRSHFLTGDIADAPDEDLMEWTKMQDRGGLLFIGDKALNFFTEVGLNAESVETPAGDVDFDAVRTRVLSGPDYYIWDSLIQGELSARADSDCLLDMCCKYFCNTWGVGTAKMKRNLLHSKGTDNATLRPSLMTQKS